MPNIRVIANTQGIYNAELQVEASTIGPAKVIAVDRVQELLTLFAIHNFPFEINYSDVIANPIAQEESAPALVREDKTRTISVPEYLETPGPGSAIVSRDDVQFETYVLKHREQWPDWLRTALKLNYIAVVSHDIQSAFIIECATLELLTAGIQDRPSSVLDSELEPNKAKQLISEINKTLHDFGLSNESIGRLLSRVKDTQVKGKVDRITEALNKCGIDAQPKDVRLVVQQRGSVVHTGQSSDVGELGKALEFVRDWVQVILGNPHNYP